MNRLLPLFGIALLGLAGCSGGSDAGDVASAEKAAQQRVTSPDQLPKDMSPEGRRIAEAAMGQSAAIRAQMEKDNAGRIRAAGGH